MMVKLTSRITLGGEYGKKTLGSAPTKLWTFGDSWVGKPPLLIRFKQSNGTDLQKLTNPYCAVLSSVWASPQTTAQLGTKKKWNIKHFPAFENSTPRSFLSPAILSADRAFSTVPISFQSPCSL
jgi:hypothetical protein